MSTMFGTLCAPRRGVSILGTLVSLGFCGCGATDDPEPTGPAPTDSSVNPATPSATVTSPNTSPSVVNPVAPQPVNPVAPPTGPGVTPPVTPSVQPPTPTTGGVNPVPVPVDPTPSSTGPGPVTSDTTGETTTPVAPTGNCQITATGEVSSKISTVGIVTFTSDVAVTSAKIEFTNMAGGDTLTAPVDVAAEGHRTLLLGMKPNATYTYKVIVNDSCSSQDYSITTGAIPIQGAPRVTKTGSGGMKGYYVVSLFGQGSSNAILDQDGDVVWYGGGASGGSSRANMDWEGKYMWAVAANPFPGAGAIRRVSMDGLEDTTDFPETSYRHHDFVPLPDGIMAFIVHKAASAPTCSKVIERQPDGSVRDVIADINDVYAQVNDCHPNSIHYNADDDTYTLGDREASAFVKITRDGDLIWQVGGANPKGASFAGVQAWDISHGHHLFEEGGTLHMLVFNNGSGGFGGGGGGSKILEFSLDEAAMTGTQVWSHDLMSTTAVLGDVQRLPNGNTLVALTTNNVVREISPAGATVQEFNVGGQVGYVDYRPTLYGLPAKKSLNYKWE